MNGIAYLFDLIDLSILRFMLSECWSAARGGIVEEELELTSAGRGSWCSSALVLACLVSDPQCRFAGRNAGTHMEGSV